jgi:hypothetical protein
MYRLVAVIVTSIWLAGLPFSQSKISSEITFCNFEVPEQLRRANLSFYLSYSFELNDDGAPVKFVKIRNQYLKEDQILACLETWRFSGLRRGAKIVATFRWTHGEGWVQVAIVGPGYKQIVRKNP